MKYFSCVRLYIKLLICMVFFTTAQSLKAQVVYDKLIQINGVIMSSDSLFGIPDVTVSVKGQDKGTYSSPLGVFTLVCFKGDTLQFRALGFKQEQYIIPDTIKGNTISMVKLMSQDTFYLNETIIYALPSRDKFDFAFQNLHIDDDRIEIARQNSNIAMLRMMSGLIPKAGGENQQYVQQSAAYRAAYEGMRPPMNIFSPIKWVQFLEAWKRGDFRKKNP